jgi:ferritin-like metal-binding protein YciE
MTLQDLLVAELQDLYAAEHQQREILPRLAAAARGEALAAVLSSHAEETRTHVSRLDEVFALLGTARHGAESAGMKGIIDGHLRMLTIEQIDGAVLDAGLIAGAQKAEHYEICGYGTCAAWARTLGLDQVASMLDQTLAEERAADQALNDLAVQEVNISATHEGR